MEAHLATEQAWTEQLDPAATAAVGDAIDALGSLRVLDATALRLLALCDDPDAATHDLVETLERDPSFAANLLRLACSATYARPVRARTVRQAVMLVGRRALKRLALQTATFRFFERVGGVALGPLHVHAASVAVVSGVLADLVDVEGDGVHLAGLLHDCGRLVLPQAFGEEACAALAARHPEGHARAAAEREAFGIDHAQAGGLLALRFDLPADVAALIAWHHGGPDGAVAPSRAAGCLQLAELSAGPGEPDPALLAAALGVTGLELGALHAAAALQAQPQASSSSPDAVTTSSASTL